MPRLTPPFEKQEWTTWLPGTRILACQQGDDRSTMGSFACSGSISVESKGVGGNHSHDIMLLLVGFTEQKEANFTACQRPLAKLDFLALQFVEMASLHVRVGLSGHFQSRAHRRERPSNSRVSIQMYRRFEPNFW